MPFADVSHALDAKVVLFIALALITLFYLVVFIVGVRRARGRGDEPHRRHARHRLRRQLLRHARHRLLRDDDGHLPRTGRWSRDERMPGTLNVGHTLPTIAQAFIYIHDRAGRRRGRWCCMIAAAVLGAWLGAGVVAALAAARGCSSGWAVALLGAAALMLARAAPARARPAATRCGLHGGCSSSA